MKQSKSLEEIKRTLKTNKAILIESFKVKEIGIFGSLVRGEEIDGSDVDILVEFYKPVGFFKFLELEEYLEKIVEKKVDLVSKKALKPRIGKYILEEVIFV
ncbi:MAG: nucleotidyltransferase family protein [bacterium]|nr:nucleotidyltransferase family protein [bacterium]